MNSFFRNLVLLLLAMESAACDGPAGGEEPDPTGKVSSVALSRNTLSLTAGDNETLTATVDPTDAENRNVTWSTDNPSVATVDTRGTVTAAKKGSATITVKTSDGGYTATCDVEVTTVAAVAVTGVTLDKTALTIELESHGALKATVAPARAANKAVSWKSSNTEVAKIDANGTLTAVTIGSAVITCTTDDGGKEATCNVTVSTPDPQNLLRSTHIPDPVFLDYCRMQMETWDEDDDGKLYAGEAAAVTSIDVANIYGNAISSLRGIEYFTGITYLDCTLNNLTSLDVSHNTRLSELYCYNNVRLASLDLSGYTALTILDCSACMLTELDLSRCTRLVELTCHHNDLVSLDVVNCTELTKLDVDANAFTALDLSRNRKLRGLICDNNALTALDLSACTALTSLSCSGNELAALDLSRNGGLIELSCDMNGLASLDVTNNAALEVLHCNNNELTLVAIGAESQLRNINGQNNRISAAGLNDMFEALPFSGSIAIAGNPGTATCDKSIAEEKNWTVKAD